MKRASFLSPRPKIKACVHSCASDLVICVLKNLVAFFTEVNVPLALRETGENGSSYKLSHCPLPASQGHCVPTTVAPAPTF